MLAQRPLQLKSAFFKHARGAEVGFEDIGRDSREAQLRETAVDRDPHGVGHDPAIPVGLGEPVTDLGFVSFARLKAMKSGSPDDPTVRRGANRPVGATSLLARATRREADPPIRIVLGVRVGDVERLIVDLLLLKMLEVSRLIAGQDVGEQKTVAEVEPGRPEFRGFQSLGSSSSRRKPTAR